MTTLLTPKAIVAALQKLSGWDLGDGRLVKRFRFFDFKEAMVFVNQVAEHAERLNHHPDIIIRYNTVELQLTTHDAGGLTDQDIHLAQEIDCL